MNVRPNGFLPIWSPVPGAAPAEFDRTLSSRPFSSTLDRMVSLNHALDQPAGARGRGDHIAAEFSHDLLEVRMPNAPCARKIAVSSPAQANASHGRPAEV